MPVLFAVPKSHRIVSFTDDERILQPACTELAYALQHQSKGSVSFAEMNGESLKERNEYRRLLHAAGFVDSPQGMSYMAEPSRRHFHPACSFNLAAQVRKTGRP